MSGKKTEQKTAKTRYEGELTAGSKRNRPSHYYKLTERDHETIKAGLTQFVSVYQIAAKIGCGYSTLKKYIAEHEELRECQEDAQKGELEFVKGKLLRKIASGSLGAMCFYLERKGGWTNKQQIQTDAPLPNIIMGVIPESELPTEGEPLKLGQIVDHEGEREDEAETAKAEERKELEAVARDEDARDRARPTTVSVDDDWGDDADGAPEIF